MRTFEISVVLPAAGILRADDRADLQAALKWAEHLSRQPGVLHVVVTEVNRTIVTSFRDGERKGDPA